MQLGKKKIYMKGIQIGKDKVKLSLITDYMILCIEIPKHYQKFVRTIIWTQ